MSPIFIGSENVDPLLRIFKVYPSWHHTLKQANLMGISILIFANDLRVYLGCTTQVYYDAGILPHDYYGWLMGRSVVNRMGWDNLIWFPVVGKFRNEIPRLRVYSPMSCVIIFLSMGGNYCSLMWFRAEICSLMICSPIMIDDDILGSNPMEKDSRSHPY